MEIIQWDSQIVPKSAVRLINSTKNKLIKIIFVNWILSNMILTQGHKYHNPTLKSDDCYIMYTKYMIVNFKTRLSVIIVK